MKKKKVWTKKDIANYFKSSKSQSDYSCAKNGIIESRYSSKSSKRKSKNKKFRY